VYCLAGCTQSLEVKIKQKFLFSHKTGNPLMLKTTTSMEGKCVQANYLLPDVPGCQTMVDTK
jgi:hypothetical protein